jgi:hypothetical protein
MERGSMKKDDRIVRLHCPVCCVYTFGPRAWLGRYEAKCRSLHDAWGPGEGAHNHDKDRSAAERGP